MGSNWPDRIKGRIPEILLGLAVVISGWMILSYTSNLTFTADEWQILFFRQHGLDSVIQPYYEHILILPTLLYRATTNLFGMDSDRPNQIIATLTFLLTAVLFFVYFRRRAGAWAALIATCLLLFLGAAFEDFLLAFQIAYYGSLAAGIAALLALDRDDRKGDVAACALLVLSLLWSTLAIPFVIGAFVEWALNPRDRRRRIFVPGATIVVYGLWWIGWGHNADASGLSFHNLVDLPEYVGKAIASGFTSLAGLATGDGSLPSQPHLIWGALLAAAALIASGLRIRHLGKVPREVWITGALALSFWVLAGLNQSDVRLPTSSRYQLPSAVFILLIAANMLKGVKIGNRELVVAGLLSALAIQGGVHLMHEQKETRWEPSSTYVKTYLGAVDLAGSSARPDYVIDLRTNAEIDKVIPIGLWQQTVADHGSPGYDEGQIYGAEPQYRATADTTSIDVAGLQLSGAPPALTNPECTVLKDPVADSPLEVSSNQLTISAGGKEDLAVALSRYSDPPGAQIGSVLAGSEAGLTLPPDNSTRNWRLSFGGDGPAKVCEGRP